MNVVVTGATSFIGAATVRQLLEKGHRVCAVVRPGSLFLQHLYDQVPEEQKDHLYMVFLDMKDIEKIQNQGLSWGQWIHIGWDGAGSENRMKRDVQQANVVHSLSAVKAAKRLGCKRFLFTGSQAEYGVCQGIMGEDIPCNPVSEYAKAKVDFGNQGKVLCKSLDMEYIHTRIFSIYGPGDHPWSLVHTCLKTWMAGETIKLGECTQQWNFLYIEDVAAAILHLLTEGRTGVYNIASDDTRVLREFIEMMYEQCGKKGSYLYGLRPPNAEGPASLIPDITKIKAETGWSPGTSFEEGINETMHCLQKEVAG